MSEELELDAEFAALESQLSKLSPNESQVDRDTLLYQAGWEAALANKNSDKNKSPRLATKESASRYLAISFAAISALLAFLLIQPTPTPSTPSPAEFSNLILPPKQAKPAQSIVTVIVPKRSSAAIADRYPMGRPVLRGRRDPERWLRETDRMMAASFAPLSEGPRTIQDWYRDIQSEENPRDKRNLPVGDQL